MTPSCYVLLISAFCVASVICSNVTVSEKALIHDLLNNYRKVGVPGRPVKDHTHPVKVKMGIRLTKILDFDQENDKLTIAAWLILGWVDEYLQFDASSGIKRVFVPPSEIWIPDIYLFNAVEPPLRMIEPRVIVGSNGNTTWVPSYKFTSVCNSSPDIEEATCLLLFGSWVFNNKELEFDYQMKGIDAGEYYPHEDWELLKTNAHKRDEEHGYKKGDKFVRITYSLTLRKRPKEDEDKNKDNAALPVGQHSNCKIWLVSLTVTLSLLKSL